MRHTLAVLLACLCLAAAASSALAGTLPSGGAEAYAQTPLGRHLQDLLLILLIAIGPLPLCLLALLGAERRPRAPGHALLVVLSGWCAIQASIGTGLGLIHRLLPPWVIGTEILAAAVGGVGLYRAGRGRWLAGLCRAVRPARGLSLSEGAILAAAWCLGMELCWRVCVLPMTEWDSLSYHLPTMATWRQTGSLAMLEQFRNFQRFYPYAWEAACSLFLVPFQGDQFVGLPNILAWALFGLGVYCLAAQAGAGRAASMASAVLVASTAEAAFLVTTMHVDLQLAAFLVAGAYFGLLYARTRARHYLGLWLAMIGLASGTKTSGLVYAAMLAAWLAVMLILARATQPRREQAATGRCGMSTVLAGFACLLLVGGYWYLRNWIACGNPLGCVEVRLGRVVVFANGSPHNYWTTALWHLFDITRSEHWGILLGQVWSHLRLPFLTVVLLALIAPLTSRAWRSSEARRALPVLLAFALVAAVAYVFTPFSGDVRLNGWIRPTGISAGLRYALPLVSVLAVTGAVGIAAIGLPASAAAALAIAGVFLELRGSHWLLSLALLGIAWGLTRGLQWPPLQAGRPARWALLGVVLIGYTTTVTAVSYRAHRERDARRIIAYGPIVPYLSTHVAPGKTVASALTFWTYALYGTDLNREVRVIPLGPRDAKWWREVLARWDIGAVAVGPMRRRPTREERRDLAWLDSPASPLIRVLGTDVVTEGLLYRPKPIVSGPGQEATASTEGAQRAFRLASQRPR